MKLDIDVALNALRRHRSVESAALELGVGGTTLRRQLEKQGLRASDYTQGGRAQEVSVARDLSPEATVSPVTASRSPSLKTHFAEHKHAELMPEDKKRYMQEFSLERVLICPDVHVPYEHERSWNCFLDVARRWRPDHLVILGDFADFYQVSQYPKDPKRRLTFEDEIAAVNRELRKIRDLTVPHVIFCEGNHETRLSRYVAEKAPAFGGIIDIRALVDTSGWDWVPYGHHAEIGKLSFTHDVGHAGANAARQSVQAFGGNVVFGHTHRAASHYESTVHGDRHAGFTMGWLGDPEAIDYRHRARVLRENQHGFGVAWVELSTGLGWVHFVPIIEGRAVVAGELYDGRAQA
jgi:hypothetical protein